MNYNTAVFEAGSEMISWMPCSWTNQLEQLTDTLHICITCYLCAKYLYPPSIYYIMT